MNLEQIRQKRAAVLREAEALKRADGTFADDQARAAFDAKMTEIDALDAQIRTLEAAPAPAPAADPVAAERARVLAIQSATRTAGLDDAFARQHVDAGTSIDKVRELILDQMAARSEQHPIRTTIVPGEDARDKFIRGSVNWLLQRSGMAGLVAQHQKITADKLDPGEFRGLSLIDLARESLTRAGVSFRGADRLHIAGLAMSRSAGYQTTSDFSTMLENAMHKVLQAAYAITPDTWSRFCGVGTVTDFRAHNWYRLGALSSLDTINEHGEFNQKSIPDAEKATYSATTKGNIIGITREVVVNDDLGAVMRLMQMLGRAGKLTIEKAVYALLAQNSGLGPTMADTYTLFHASHNNISTSAALSAAAIDADRVAMALQMDPNSQEYADLRPAILLIGVALGGQARVINTSQYDPDTVANKSQMKPNVVAGLFRDIVDSPRVTSISSTRRYLFADPAVAPVILVSFLEGQREPVLETQDGWRYNGVEMRARLDFGVDAVDYRGAVTNAGT